MEQAQRFHPLALVDPLRLIHPTMPGGRDDDRGPVEAKAVAAVRSDAMPYQTILASSVRLLCLGMSDLDLRSIPVGLIPTC